MNLGQLLHEVALRRPRQTALVCREQALTYEQLDEAARGVARRLLGDGLAPGALVGIHSMNSIEAVILALACLHADLVALPVNWRLKPAELAYIMEDSGVAAWFSQAELAPQAEAARASMPGAPLIWTELPQALAGGELPEFDVDRIATIMYTSGTTSRPKGVIHTHRTLVEGARLIQGIGLKEGDIPLQMTSLMHASGLHCTTLPTLLTGGRVVMLPAFDAAAALDAIERHRCNFALGLSAMLQFVVEEQERRPRDLSSVRIARAGGDTVPVALQERFEHWFGVPLLEVYGMTEGVPVTCNVEGAARTGSVGRAVPGVAVRVLDLSGCEVAPGETGELAFRSPSGFTGYWRDERGTAATLVDGWVLSGDLVRCDADGYYWFEGRKKEIIIRGGSNVAPQEVEEALYHHPAVLEVGVIGVPDPIFGEQVVACVSLKEGRMVGKEELRAYARERLADYKVPERIVFLRELPKGVTGKVQRRALKELAGEEAMGQSASRLFLHRAAVGAEPARAERDLHVHAVAPAGGIDRARALHVFGIDRLDVNIAGALDARHVALEADVLGRGRGANDVARAGQAVVVAEVHRLRQGFLSHAGLVRLGRFLGLSATSFHGLLHAGALLGRHFGEQIIRNRRHPTHFAGSGRFPETEPDVKQANVIGVAHEGTKGGKDQ
jgi:long-chain acyl-CoA synthetase